MQEHHVILPGDLAVPMVDPAVWLWHLCRTSSEFAEYLQQAMRRTNGAQREPLDLILYSDEVSPGNQLKPDNRRGLIQDI